MSNNKELPVRTTGTGDDQVFYLRSGDATADTEITKKQYDSIIEFGQSGSTGSTGTLTEANILRLHQEADPASEFYKGPEVDNEAEEPVVQQGYYDLNAKNIEGAQQTSPDSTTAAEDPKSPPADESTDTKADDKKAK